MAAREFTKWGEEEIMGNFHLFSSCFVVIVVVVVVVAVAVVVVVVVAVAVAVAAAAAAAVAATSDYWTSIPIYQYLKDLNFTFLSLSFFLSDPKRISLRQKGPQQPR